MQRFKSITTCCATKQWFQNALRSLINKIKTNNPSTHHTAPPINEAHAASFILAPSISATSSEV